MQRKQGIAAALIPSRAVPPFRVYVVTNHKGGQGKTTVAVSLGAEFARRGYVVRMVDCDPQLGSMTFWLPPQWDDLDPAKRPDLLDVLMASCGLDEATYPTTVPGLYLVPSFTTATQFDNHRPPGADLALRQAIDEASPADVTLIDCPPNLGQLTVSGVTAGESVIVPVWPGGLDMVGVADLNQTLSLIKRRLNPSLSVDAIVLREPKKTRLGDQIGAQLRADFPDAIHQVMPETVRVQEAPFEHEPIQEYAPNSTTARAFSELADRLDERAAVQVSL